MSRPFKLYVVVLHLLLFALFLRSDLFRVLTEGEEHRRPPHFERSVVFHERALEHASEGFVAVLGDSHVEGMAVSRLHGQALNLGIGGDTTDGLLERVGRYSDLGRASLIVLAVGLNDLRRDEPANIASRYGSLLDELPDRPVLCSGVLPVSREAEGRPDYAPRIRQLNKALAQVCRERPAVTFVSAFDRMADDDGYLYPRFDGGDGVHLSRAGYEEWIAALRASAPLRESSSR